MSGLKINEWYYTQRVCAIIDLRCQFSSSASASGGVTTANTKQRWQGAPNQHKISGDICVFSDVLSQINVTAGHFSHHHLMTWLESPFPAQWLHVYLSNSDKTLQAQRSSKEAGVIGSNTKGDHQVPTKLLIKIVKHKNLEQWCCYFRKHI